MIDQARRILKLKEFYVLERFQVVYYKSQWSSSVDPYYNHAFERLVYIESAHADYFAQALRQRNVSVPVVTGSLMELAGRILGEGVELTGPYNTCKLGLALENNAKTMYEKFIAETEDDPELHKTLMDYRLEEEFHTLWIENYMKKLAP